MQSPQGKADLTSESQDARTFTAAGVSHGILRGWPSFPPTGLGLPTIIPHLIHKAI